MSVTRNIVRGLAAGGAAVGLTLAGAGAAAAAVVTPGTHGHTITSRIDDPRPFETCGALAMPPYVAAELGGAFLGGDIIDIITVLAQRPDVYGLAREGTIFDTPTTIPGVPGTLYAENVPANFYILVTLCSDGASTEPHFHPIMVGDPLAAFGGSVEGSLGGGS